MDDTAHQNIRIYRKNANNLHGYIRRIICSIPDMGLPIAEIDLAAFSYGHGNNAHGPFVKRENARDNVGTRNILQPCDTLIQLLARAFP
jgi:hypothetical protein